ncbi:protein phosphatase [Streptomyces sp. AV19]|uniref:protein-tyrosine phosphatase family protein n=1 Tax=Streptomyces sp. AV19 TaxID=2793068 RepID=UPI0018FE600A|nr:protein phosphatase [Streptomyces sp. AV19]MBH1938411.1 protein phosphatase [Streptomyces sp. AV19]MDG4535060.1 protein phosphatase [Streptomyces sp. AV19]
MRVHQKNHGEPEPQAPWDEVVPGLWIGGHHWADASGERHPAVAGGEFDLVVSLFSRPGHGPDPAVRHLITEIPDDPLDAGQLRAVRRLARIVARTVRAGRVTLVRCNAGYNRSGLVVAQALVELGGEAPAAIDAVRRGRGPWALNNRIFEEYLTAGLDVACLLAGLEAPD